MANQSGVAIHIKAFLPAGKTPIEQFEALSKVKEAHETGDYSALLSAATIDEVKTEMKTRRIEPATSTKTENTQAGDDQGEAKQESAEPKPADDGDVPAFLKKEKTKAA